MTQVLAFRGHAYLNQLLKHKADGDQVFTTWLSGNRGMGLSK